MTLIFEDECGIELPFDKETIAKQVMEAALDYVDCPYEAEINLILTDDEEIRRVNKEFRDIDKATDVLSFPAIDYEQSGEFDFLEEADEYFNPETGELLLGDMMISVPRILQQAEEYGHSVLREYAFLIAHSMLHLAGYDHMEEEERVEMESMQEEIMNKLRITRE